MWWGMCEGIVGRGIQGGKGRWGTVGRDERGTRNSEQEEKRTMWARIWVMDRYIDKSMVL